ncbi:MAG: pyridoxamine 5'-phosphate oxidase family protein [Pseudonocardia sp.]|nr:pyridoxamine 5'-phosphate oxidase family protein [Pseudonocardia sp.]
MDTLNLAELYDLPPMDWDLVRAGLDAGFSQKPGSGGPDRHTSWLTTIDADGAPHVTSVGALWADGAFWFQTGDGTRKGRNLRRDPRCALAVAAREFDLVVKGTARRVTDPAAVAARAEEWAAGGWPVRVDGSGTALTAEYSAPSAGRPPWHVHRIDAVSASAVATVEPGGATSWRFRSARPAGSSARRHRLQLGE